VLIILLIRLSDLIQSYVIIIPIYNVGAKEPQFLYLNYAYNFINYRNNLSEFRKRYID
jgi:hypothetical protein